MKIILISFAVFLGLSSLIIILSALYSGKAIKRLIINALLGFAVVGAINITSKFTGVYIYINPITVLGTTVFSVPAVIGFLLLNIIIL